MRKFSIQYQVFVILTSCISLVLLGVMAFAKNLDPSIVELILYFDHFICAIFFIDFLISFKKAENKFQFMKFGWLDLLASIPSIEILRVARLARIFRVIRAIKSTKYLVSTIQKNKKANALLVVSISAILLIFVGAVSILQFENAPNSNINTPEIAVWWSFVTITTVGYGDYYPVTTAGRILASVLMIYGIGLFGALSGVFASYFMGKNSDDESNEIQELKKEIRELKDMFKNNNDKDAA